MMIAESRYFWNEFSKSTMQYIDANSLIWQRMFHVPRMLLCFPVPLTLLYSYYIGMQEGLSVLNKREWERKIIIN